MDGEPAEKVHSDLTAKRRGGGIDLTASRRILANVGVAFMGDTKGGPFDIPGDLAREWLRLPANPNGRPNADVLKPWVSGMDLTRRPAGKWIVDYGMTTTAEDAAVYEEPFRWIQERVRPTWEQQRAAGRRHQWWLHHRPRPKMWRALEGLPRFIATPTVAKHRLFVWLDTRICPDHQLIVIARDDDVTFGILHSRFREAWSLRLGTWLGKGNDPRYTSRARPERSTWPRPRTCKRSRGTRFRRARSPCSGCSSAKGGRLRSAAPTSHVGSRAAGASLRQDDRYPADFVVLRRGWALGMRRCWTRREAPSAVLRGVGWVTFPDRD